VEVATAATVEAATAVEAAAVEAASAATATCRGVGRDEAGRAEGGDGKYHKDRLPGHDVLLGMNGCPFVSPSLPRV
jgi:hypothetical protein